MKVVILNTSERIGGAAIAANRLMRVLRKSGIEASMLVLNKQTDDENVVLLQKSIIDKLHAKWNFLWERLTIFVQNGFSRRNLFRVSIANTGFDISKHPLIQSADIIHLHWINQGFLSLKGINKLIQTGRPVVWTLHDMWPITSICHHAGKCPKYKKECGCCPFLKSSRKKDLSYKIMQGKVKIFNNTIKLVAVSNWLAELTKQSAISGNNDVFVIPNGIDLTSFKPRNEKMIRKQYALPENKKIILMGSARLDDPIKGFDNLKKALSSLLLLHKYKREDLLLVVFGRIKDIEAFEDALPIPYISLGLISDVNKISDLYSAVDVTVVPSYYETFGQTIIESMACATPVVTFSNSGQTDIIDHKRNGYLAEFENNVDFANGIDWILQNKDVCQLSEKCTRKVQESFSDLIISEKYISLYENLLKI